MLEIRERSKLKVKIYGDEFELMKPTLGEVERMQTEVNDLDDKSKMQAIKSFVVGLGLPEQKLMELEVDHLTELIEYLSGSKKK